MTTTTTTTAAAGPKVGDRAPDFTVKTTDGTLFTLSQATKADHVVVAFFPAAFTSVCTKEMCTFTERLGELQSKHAKFIGVSGDSHFTQKAWAEKNGIKTLLGSDYNHEVTPKYGVNYALWKEFYKGTAKRSVFVVDKQGVVRFKWVTEDPTVEPNYDEVQKVVAGL